MKKPRCPECGSIAVAIYRRRGANGAWERLERWAWCDDHGAFQY